MEFPYYEGNNGRELAHQHGFVKGRESFGDKEFHLTRDELANILVLASHYEFNLEQIIKYITPLIYPHIITVDFEDGIYYFETLKAKY